MGNSLQKTEKGKPQDKSKIESLQPIFLLSTHKKQKLLYMIFAFLKSTPLSSLSNFQRL